MLARTVRRTDACSSGTVEGRLPKMAKANGETRFIGRYAVYSEIAAGGMATVHVGRLLGTAGFARTVAIKCLHSQFAKDPEFVAMFLDEARVAARVRHPNVVPTIDVVATDGELFLVMEYVQGETLARLLRLKSGERRPGAPPRIAATIASHVLHGLHAAHQATSESGEPLGIVHRDVSPQNVLVGVDGVARVLDFGIAKARDRIHITRGGLLKGKVSYMAPEQLAGAGVDCRTDVYAAGVILWEALVGRRLFDAEGDFAIAERVRTAEIAPPSSLVADLPAGTDALVLRALDRAPAARWASAREMALAIESTIGVANPSEVTAWVEATAGPTLEVRANQIASIERSSTAKAGPRTAIGQTDPALLDLDGEQATRALPRQDEIDPDGSAPTRAIDSVAATSASGTRIGLSRTVVPSSSRRARALLWSAAGGGVLLTMVLAFALTRSSGGGGPVAADDIAPTPAATARAPETEPSTSVPPAPAPAVESLPPAVASSAPARGSPITPMPVRRATPCNPPYVTDARGVRHLKRECL